MNVNFLFSIILLGLLAIFFLFKPLDLQQKVFDDVPLFELNQFTLYEVNQLGLATLMNGDNAFKFTNRYEVTGINYTDNSHEYIANMKADYGEYQDDIMLLKDNIVYLREDGLTFETNKLRYNKQTDIVVSETPYVAFRGANIITGESLIYDNLADKLESQKVNVTYNLGDKI